MNQAVVFAGSFAEAFHESPVDFSAAGDSIQLREPVIPVSVVDMSTASPSGFFDVKVTE